MNQRPPHRLLAGVTLIAFVAGLFPQRVARADDTAASAPAPVVADTSTSAPIDAPQGKSDTAPAPVATAAVLPNGPLYTTQLPNGADKSGVKAATGTVAARRAAHEAPGAKPAAAEKPKRAAKAASAQE